MPTLSPSLLIAAAQSLVCAGEILPHARAALNDRWPTPPNDGSGGPTWHTDFIDWVGFASHYDLRTQTSRWPLPPACDCTGLADFASARGVLTTEPEPGDLFLLWSPLLRGFARSGIVAEIDSQVELDDGTRIYHCLTVEGNTSREFSHHGGEILCHDRRLEPARGDRFINWASLGRERAA